MRAARRSFHFQKSTCFFETLRGRCASQRPLCRKNSLQCKSGAALSDCKEPSANPPCPPGKPPARACTSVLSAAPAKRGFPVPRRTLPPEPPERRKNRLIISAASFPESVPSMERWQASLLVFCAVRQALVLLYAGGQKILRQISPYICRIDFPAGKG